MAKLILLFLILATTAASADCFCKGCGCKGGPGWRGPNGHCVSHRALTKTCGNPPGAPCSYEGARQVCDSPARLPHFNRAPWPTDKKN